MLATPPASRDARVCMRNISASAASAAAPPPAAPGGEGCSASGGAEAALGGWQMGTIVMPPGIIMASTVDTRGGGLIKRVKRKAFKIRDAFVKLKETANQSDHFPVEERPSAGEQTVSVESLDSLIFHASLVTLVMLAGYVMRTPYAACANGISQHTRITAPFLHSH